MEWTASRYGSSEFLELSKILRLGVRQEIGMRDGPTPPWRASVFGTALKASFSSREEAKDAALRVARKHLAIAIQTIS